MSDYFTNSVSIPERPEYSSKCYVWNKIDDCLNGEDAIKSSGELYLRKTPGMRNDPKFGESMYRDYVDRADWYDLPQQFTLDLFGILWQKDPTINVPEEMELKFIPSPSYSNNKSFIDVYRETSKNIIKYDRHGILLDVPNHRDRVLETYPVMVQFNTRQIKHWGYTEFKGQQVLKYVVLDESTIDYNNETLTAHTCVKYRFLGLKTMDGSVELDEPIYYTYTGTDEFKAILDPPFDSESGIVNFEGFRIIYPNIHGKYANTIPFFCFSSTDMSLEPNTPIIYPLCNASLSLYRSSADINEALYKQAFALLFAKGFDSDSDVYVGTQKMISCASPDSDLKYVEISGTGLSEQRIALENKYNRARDIGLSILNSGSTGESVKTSINMKVASLKSISKTLADGFTSICKFAAYWRGLKEEDINSIKILPNMEFTISSNSNNVINGYSLWSSSIKGLTDFDYYTMLRENGRTSYTTFDSWYNDLVKEQNTRTNLLKSININVSDKNDGLNSKESLPAEEGGDHLNDKLNPNPDGKSKKRNLKKK